MIALPTLPVSAVLPDLVAALADNPCAVLEAPPGAGKTTLVPLALLDANDRLLVPGPAGQVVDAVAGGVDVALIVAGSAPDAASRRRRAIESGRLRS